MLTYVENGTEFTAEFGDINEAYYSSMETVLTEMVNLFQKEGSELYPKFQERIVRLETLSDGIGWGYHDFIREQIYVLETENEKRRNFDLLLTDIRRCLANSTQGGRYFVLYDASCNVGNFIEMLAQDVEKTRALLELMRLFRESRGPGNNVGEEKFMDQLACISRESCRQLEDAGLSRFPSLATKEDLPPEAKSACDVVRVLYDYAMECFQYKRSRDTFAGLRRSGAFHILESIGRMFDLTEIINKAGDFLLKRNNYDT